MAHYVTEQRKALYEFFMAHPHEPFSAKEIHAILSDSNISISAVYRNLGAMKKEGLVRCHIKLGSRDMLYQFFDKTHCANAIHLTCVDCGKTFHMNKDIAQTMQVKLAEMEGFQIHQGKTVLYGTCRECTSNL